MAPDAAVPETRRVGSGPAVPIGAVLFVAGVIAFFAAPHLSGRSAKVNGAVAPVNASASDRLSNRAQNSPTLLANPVNPANLIIVSRVDTQPFSCALDVSMDGGRTWTPSPVPAIAGKRIGCFGPDAAFSPDGVLYVSFVSQDQVPDQGIEPDAAWVSRSTDGGHTLGAPVQVTGPSPFQLRIAADNHRAGRLYLTWLQASGVSNWGLAADGNPIVLSRSDDGGATWSKPVSVSPPGRLRVIAPTINAAPDGRVYVAYLDVGDDRLDYLGAHEGKGGDPYNGRWTLVVASSPDGGAAWNESNVDGIVPTQRFLQLYPPTPALATDAAGKHIYVAFQDGRLGTPDILVWTSDDGARVWSGPHQVNATGKSSAGTQYLAALAVSPGGRLDVVYYDRHADKADVLNEVSLQSSYDDGRTFTARLRVSDRPFDSRVGLGSQRGMPQLGSRLAVLSTSGGALAVWTDTRGGTSDTGKQDLAKAAVAMVPTSSWRAPLRQGGVGIAMAGVMIAAYGFVSRRAALHRRKSNTPTGSIITPAGDPLHGPEN